MNETLAVGFIGLGSIAQRLLELIAEGRAGSTTAVGALVRDPAKAREAAGRHGVPLVADLDGLLATGPSLVIECAGHDAVRAYARRVLAAGRDLVLLSVGALADDGLRRSIEQAATRTGRRVLVPSGAIAGLDAIGAAALGELASVTHVVRKNPRAFSASQLRGVDTTRPAVLYEGPARTGIPLFPENVNVAAAIALAGVGFDRTVLRVVADPTVERNTHEVEATGSFGRLRVAIENIPGPNPKTGRIVALSVANVLARRTAPLVIGG